MTEARIDTINALQHSLLLTKRVEEAIASKLHAIAVGAIDPSPADAVDARYVLDNADALASALASSFGVRD